MANEKDRVRSRIRSGSLPRGVVTRSSVKPRRRFRVVLESRQWPQRVIVPWEWADAGVPPIVSE